MGHSTFIPAANAKTRFSDRVEAYVRYRPGYPSDMIDCLQAEFGLRPEHAIADIGSGTGLSIAPFLNNGNRVFGVEPNAEMRQAAERLLAGYPAFTSVNGSAEATTLPDSSIDWITAGQAFHWFDVERCRAEFKRVLRPGGQVALFWNNRRDETPLLAEYVRLIAEFANDYEQINHANVERDGRLPRFFGGGHFATRGFANLQEFDFDGLKGRLDSSSYMPPSGDPPYSPMLARLREIFDRHKRDGLVRFEYETRLFVGPLR